MFGNWTLITQDRSRHASRCSSPAARRKPHTGTGGGIVADYPQVRQGWSGNKLGDLWLGGKVNLLAASTKPLGIRHPRTSQAASRRRESIGASSGATDFQFDGIVSSSTNKADISGFAGFMVRGRPGRLRTDQRTSLGLRRGLPGCLRERTEVHGGTLRRELLRLDTITAPAGLFGRRTVPSRRFQRNQVAGRSGPRPDVAALERLLHRRRGRLQLHHGRPRRRPRARAWVHSPDVGGDQGGFQVRIGFHPGTKNRTAPPPPPPPSHRRHRHRHRLRRHRRPIGRPSCSAQLRPVPRGSRPDGDRLSRCAGSGRRPVDLRVEGRRRHRWRPLLRARATGPRRISRAPCSSP